MTTRDHHPGRTRSRWAAVGAAVAVTLGAGTIVQVGAATGTEDTDGALYQAVVPCRLTDTRPAPNTVGPRDTPLGAGESITIDARGAEGECPAASLPDDAVAVALNVTALNASAGSFLTFWPGGDRPNAASLNPAPGQPPIPNAVTTQLSASGTFDVYNEAGAVDVVIDVVGFYTDHEHDETTDHQHDDRYDTSSEVDQKIADALATIEPGLELERTTLVSPVGTDAENGDALRAALDAAGDVATPDAPWNVFVEPGVYEFGPTIMHVDPYVSLVGSGRSATTLVAAAGTAPLSLGSDAELRDVALSVAPGEPSSSGPLFVGGDGIVIEDVVAIASDTAGIEGFGAAANFFGATDLTVDDLRLESNGPGLLVRATWGRVSGLDVSAVHEAIRFQSAGTPTDRLNVRSSSLVSSDESVLRFLDGANADVLIAHSTLEALVGATIEIDSGASFTDADVTITHSWVDTDDAITSFPAPFTVTCRVLAEPGGAFAETCT